MFKDVITYELASGIDEAQLLSVASKIIESWMSKQIGFVRWEIHKNSIDNGYTDIVIWEDREAAKAAEEKMINIPHAAEWFSCYKEGSIASQNLEQIGSFE